MNNKSLILTTVLTSIFIITMSTVFMKCTEPIRGGWQIDTTGEANIKARMMAYSDSLADAHAVREMKWYDTIISLKKRLKTPLLRWKTVYREIHDTAYYPKTLPLSNDFCCEQITFANDLIMQQDSLTQFYGNGLAQCLNDKETLNAQIKFNRELSLPECPVYKKLVWRLYLKK